MTDQQKSMIDQALTEAQRLAPVQTFDVSVNMDKACELITDGNLQKALCYFAGAAAHCVRLMDYVQELIDAKKGGEG